MELADDEFRVLVALYSCNRGVPISRAIMAHLPYPERQSLLDKELVEIHYSPTLSRLFVTEKGEAALREEPVRALRTIESMSAFGRSMNWVRPEVIENETYRLHQGAKEMMSSLAPCQLPEFLSHENSWMRHYAEERLRETKNENDNY